ncbi:MAG: hypothetical protein QOH64_2692 [Acidimicrobiaceae bacterium]|jgi:hypothetical protein
MGHVGDLLVVTVDVECDAVDDGSWRNSSPLTFAGVHHGLGEVLAGVLADTGACATLLVSNVVLADTASVATLRGLSNVELGTHLHGDFAPPDPRCADPAGVDPRDNQCEYDDSTERAKLEAITETFSAAFGERPKSFRAGRWSAGGRTARLLTELGYVADSSVTPHVWWTDNGRSVDFRGAPEQPYHPSGDDISRPGDLPLWELPVSIRPRWWMGGRAGWLRPSTASAPTMRWVVGAQRRAHPGPRTFVMMFHNVELTPGTNPYARTPAAAARVATRLRRLLTWARDEGMEFATLSQAAAMQEGATRGG